MCDRCRAKICLYLVFMHLTTFNGGSVGVSLPNVELDLDLIYCSRHQHQEDGAVDAHVIQHGCPAILTVRIKDGGARSDVQL